MEKFSFPAGWIPGEISSGNSNRQRNCEKYLEKLHQEYMHRRGWSQCLIDKQALAASHQQAFSGGSVADMKKEDYCKL